MTEDEAKTKWCPFARCGANDWNMSVAVNRFDDLPKWEAHCIASACMAWRWAKPRRRYSTSDDRKTFIEETIPSLDGHCGLAGTP